MNNTSSHQPGRGGQEITRSGLQVETWKDSKTRVSNARILIPDKKQTNISIAYNQNEHTISISLGTPGHPPVISLVVLTSGLALEVIPSPSSYKTAEDT